MRNDRAGRLAFVDRLNASEHDLVALGIAVAAIILFVGTGSSVLSQTVQAWTAGGEPPDRLAVSAMLLNIALLLLGWRRYNELQREIAIRRRAEARAKLLAERDPLTNCLNRRSNPAAVETLLRDTLAKDMAVAVFVIDSDNFKRVNDLHGHQLGDAVLRTIAERITEQLPKGATIARIGGDEFACAIPYPRGHSDAIEAIAEAVITKVGYPIAIDGRQMEATISLGISSSEMEMESNDIPTSERLMHRADMAMYHAKKRGRNRYFWFEAQMEDDIRFRSRLESGIRQGLDRNEFVPFYEQQVELETGRLVGFEMLARWRSRDFGLVSPEIFISVAEEMDLIGKLSEQLIRQALRDACEWDQSISLSVNISPVQLRDPWFAQKILKMLTETGFAPGRLEIEITESCLHKDIGAVRSMLSSLQNQGVRVSLDDFGTGYSSLAQLRSLSFDRLKIDRSFVTDIASEEIGSELLQAIVALGRGLAIPVTAEGIESGEVLEKLRDFGDIKGQGYLYGVPEDADAVRQRLAGLGLLAAPPELYAVDVEPQFAQALKA